MDYRNAQGAYIFKNMRLRVILQTQCHAYGALAYLAYGALAYVRTATLGVFIIQGGTTRRYLLG